MRIASPAGPPSPKCLERPAQRRVPTNPLNQPRPVYRVPQRQGEAVVHRLVRGPVLVLVRNPALVLVHNPALALVCFLAHLLVPARVCRGRQLRASGRKTCSRRWALWVHPSGNSILRMRSKHRVRTDKLAATHSFFFTILFFYNTYIAGIQNAFQQQSKHIHAVQLQPAKAQSTTHR